MTRPRDAWFAWGWGAIALLARHTWEWRGGSKCHVYERDKLAGLWSICHLRYEWPNDVVERTKARRPVPTSLCGGCARIILSRGFYGATSALPPSTTIVGGASFGAP